MAKSKYQPDFPERVERYLRQGANDDEAAAKLGINRATYYRYQNEYSDFSDAIKRGKAPVDFEVENAALKGALGYEYEETHTEIRHVGDKEVRTVKRIKKYMPPNPTFAIFWLVNRSPDRWRSVNRDQEWKTPSDIDDKLKAIADAITESDTNSGSTI